MQKTTPKIWIKLKAFFASEYALLAMLVTAVAILMRIFTFDIQSGDYRAFLTHWFDALKEGGGFQAIGMSLGDYTPAYLYILAFLTYFPVPSLYSIKAVSCLFDIVLAVFVGLCVKEYTQNKTAATFSFSVTLLLPTVFFNSGVWAQCDSIYTAFCVACVYFLLKDKKITAVVLYGVAFSFKLQAIFLAPLLVVLWFKRKIPLYSPLLIVGVYLVFCLPAWIAGRDFWELLTVYFNQAAQYASLTLNAPTLAALFGRVPDDWSLPISRAIVFMTMCVTVLAMYLCARKVEWKKQCFVDFALLFTLAIPFLLTHMHERYFYLADIFAIVYAFTRPKRVYTALLTQFCSFYVICEYLFTLDYLSLGVVAIVQAVNVILLCKDLWKAHKRPLVKYLPPLFGQTGGAA